MLSNASFISGDMIGVLSVYIYVGLLLLLCTVALKERPFFGRKFLHFMVGNIIFLLPLFDTRRAMVLYAAFPFVILTFLISESSPLEITSKLSSKGHDLGLFYYAISWTVLAFFFFETPEVIAIGIAAMSYGDGMAGYVGKKYGKYKFSLLPSCEKSLEGSMTMFVTTFAVIPFILLYFGVNMPALYVIFVVSLSATVIEAVIGRGFDNLTIAILTAIIYYTMVHSVV